MQFVISLQTKDEINQARQALRLANEKAARELQSFIEEMELQGWLYVYRELVETIDGTLEGHSFLVSPKYAGLFERPTEPGGYWSFQEEECLWAWHPLKDGGIPEEHFYLLSL